MKFSLRASILYSMSIHRYLDFVLMLLVTIFNFKYINVKLLIAMMAVGFVSVCTILYVGYPFDKFLQQFLLLTVSVLGCEIYFSRYVKDYLSVFMSYMKLANILSIVTYIQLSIYLVTGRDVFFWVLTTAENIRVHAWIAEPGWYAAFMTPAVSYIIYNKQYRKSNKRKSIAMVLSYLLSLSALAYFALLLIFAQWIYVRYKKIVKAATIIVVALVSVLFVYAGNSKFSHEDTSFDDTPVGAIVGKIQQSIVVLMYFEPRYFEMMNASTYATMTNLWVAINAPSRIVGTGLGTHEYNYNETYKDNGYYLYGLNKVDGYSLLTRLFSEFGILGLVVVFVTLISNYNSKSVVNRSLLIFFLSMFVRGGMYTGYGIVLFAFMYHYSGKQIAEQ